MPLLSDKDAAELRRIRTKIDTLRGDGVTNNPTSIVITQPRERDRLPRRLTSGLFAVRVEQTGGSDGTSSTAASWTYTVRDVSSTVTLGTVVAVARPRPNGLMTYQSGSDGFGVAFYDDDGTLKLWDAGEVPTTGACT
jgi:hypothetical protein